MGVAPRLKRRMRPFRKTFCNLVTLSIYLSWLMHSEELRDLSIYHSLKARIYGFRRAAAASRASDAVHELRCLILLLLAHQFDAQLLRGYLADEHLDWELRALLRILREGWQRNADVASTEGLDFGHSLDQLGGDDDPG